MESEVKVSAKGFDGLTVVAFESRHAAAMEKLITTFGGRPISAPAMREIPLEDNHEAIAFADQLMSGAYDILVLLTGVGTRFLVKVAETKYPREEFIRALAGLTTVARGPKPTAALKELGLTPTVAVPPPNTWREILTTLDERQAEIPLAGKRIAVQEYGASNPQLLSGLAERGAIVSAVPVYQWALPDDLTPLREAIDAIVEGRVEVALFTTSVQVHHLLQVATQSGLESRLRDAFQRMAVASIGPTTSDALREAGFQVEIQPERAKMAALVQEAAEKSGTVLQSRQN